MSSFNDAAYNSVLPMGPVRVVAVAATANTWVPVSIPSAPNADRYRLAIESQAEPIEVRFNPADGGFVVPANTEWVCPWPLAKTVAPEVRRASVGIVRLLIGFPAA